MPGDHHRMPCRNGRSAILPTLAYRHRGMEDSAGTSSRHEYGSDQSCGTALGTEPTIRPVHKAITNDAVATINVSAINPTPHRATFPDVTASPRCSSCMASIVPPIFASASSSAAR